MEIHIRGPISPLPSLVAEEPSPQPRPTTDENGRRRHHPDPGTSGGQHRHRIGGGPRAGHLHRHRRKSPRISTATARPASPTSSSSPTPSEAASPGSTSTASGTVDFADFFLLADYFADPALGKLLALARERIGLPDGPQLLQNAPNPFNSQTVISWFQLSPDPARVEVFALTGQRVAVLHQGPGKAGVHRVPLGRHRRPGPPPGQRRIPLSIGR